MIDAVNELTRSCLHSTAGMIGRGISAADGAGEHPCHRKWPDSRRL